MSRYFFFKFVINSLLDSVTEPEQESVRLKPSNNREGFDLRGLISQHSCFCQMVGCPFHIREAVWVLEKSFILQVNEGYRL